MFVLYCFRHLCSELKLEQVFIWQNLASEVGAKQVGREVASPLFSAASVARFTPFQDQCRFSGM